jgi:hypothetical protein
VSAAAGLSREGIRAEGFDRKAASFSVAFRDEVSDYREMSVFVMPGERLEIRAIGGRSGPYRLRYGGVILERASKVWEWIAPLAPGTVQDLHVDGPSEGDTIVLHAFVLVPAAEVHDGILNGYRVGSYPSPPRGNPLYAPPRGFIEVTRRMNDARVSPHFRLNQFVCKEGPADQFPKYVVLKERLLLKLEAILEDVNAAGFHVDTLHVMSAYRTPFYNHQIGDVKFSMHQWGSAADIYVDKDNKGRMDDLNGDGIVDVQDAKYLDDLIERLVMRAKDRRFEGGLGVYRATPAHPPFVHVDVRGTHARWVG